MSAQAEPPAATSGTEPIGLASVEVDPVLLAVEGSDAEALMAGMGFIDKAELLGAFRTLPGEGWRLVNETRAERVYAAPEKDAPRTWAVVSLELREGVWRLVGSRRHERERPSRAQRRRSVELVWPGEQVFQVGATPRPWAELRNAGERVWRGDSAELLHVVAHLVDLSTGRQMLASRWVGFSPKFEGSEDLVVLPPGGSIYLPAVLATLSTDQLAPGRYGIVGKIASLGLGSSLGHIRLVEAE
ncbi:MAG: hypothetical protein JWM85_1966 [Acidimicrobiaceae bacterium]|nr:hypothetical protein [Acidimicrobiaceae bacterium]